MADAIQKADGGYVLHLSQQEAQDLFGIVSNFAAACEQSDPVFRAPVEADVKATPGRLAVVTCTSPFGDITVAFVPE